MSTELRQKALELVRNSEQISHRVCLINSIPVPVHERDLLLHQLTNGENYLLVPLSLYFRDVFWRELKVESVLLCKEKGVDIRQCRRECAAFRQKHEAANTVAIAGMDGSSVRFSIADIVEYEGGCYYFLYEYGTKEKDTGYAVFEAYCEDGQNKYCIVGDGELLGTLFDIFEERNRHAPLFCV